MNQTVWVAEKICNNFEIDCSFINVVQSEKEYLIVDLIKYPNFHKHFLHVILEI